MAMNAKDLMKFLKENPPANKFVPYSYLSTEADALTVYFEGDADYSERLTDHVTLYRSVETKEVIGCRIKGIGDIIKDLPNYIHIKHPKIDLSLIFLPFRGTADNEEARKALNTLAKQAAERKMVLESEIATSI